MYRPKFCAECGGKILRLRWRVWNSRKFCEVCSPGFLRAQICQVAIAGAALFFVGLAFGHAVRSAPPPLLIERHQDSLYSASRKPKSPASGATTPDANSVAGAGGNSSNSQAPSAEIYMCGARTKKGTPCTRRVHGPARCWQHKGLPAMLPPEKLRVPN
jgi:hypothetical protein